jgi:penicillin amidase
MRPLRIVGYSALGVVSLLALACLVVYFMLRASLPQLDGDVAVSGVKAPAKIERDALGTPTIRAASRRDLAFATGYAHGQDRFFQMDLMRRVAAGELAELLGRPLVSMDEKFRIHDFRRIAAAIVNDSASVDRELLDAYAAGVNLALKNAGARPWEYSLLRTQPAPWRVEDSVLVAFSMYLNLNDSSGEAELARSHLREALPPQLYAFLHPLGTEWDAPIVGGKWQVGPIPGAETFNLREGDARSAALNTPPGAGREKEGKLSSAALPADLLSRFRFPDAAPLTFPSFSLPAPVLGDRDHCESGAGC